MMQTAVTLNDTPVLKNRRTPLALVAYETIARHIITLAYEPGEHLEEKQLVDQLGIGRTPIREALQRLVAEKMAESHPNKGIIVSPITLQNTKAMFEAMKIVEFGVVDLAVKRDPEPFLPEMLQANDRLKHAIAVGDILDLVEANHDFHLAFARCSYNEYLVHAANDVRTHAKRLSYLSYNTSIDPDRPLSRHHESVVDEHQAMMDGLVEKDDSLLKAIITNHIQVFQGRIIRFMTS